jgi:hypothetical protein
MNTSRRSAAIVACAVVLAVVAAACAPTVPDRAQRVSPADGTGYIQPVISGDGDVVLYRREADRLAAFDAPIDLVVTRVSTRTTTVVPDVRTVHAVSHDGSHVVHGYGDLTLTSTTTGQSVVLRSGWTTGVGDVAVSADGGTVAWIEDRDTNGNCQCELGLRVWRDGTELLDLLLEGPSPSGSFDQYRSTFVAIDAAGGSVYLHRFATREVISVDVATGSMAPVALEFPPVPDISAYPDLATYLRWEESIDVGSSDGTSFRLVQGGEPYLIRVGASPLELPSHGISDPAPAISPNGRWVAHIRRTPTLPGQERRSYRVLDLLTGADREVVASDAASDPAFEPAPTFNGWGSVADTGRATFGQWAAPLSGPWPPSVIYIDR